ncbi:hypothetical protein GC105_14820 [Alkalibaculum sp. M08DMB]|uniref:Uncharacterized protein n=1 Tax=Alkalibaculum sporogenes TaxID=2655001 RepID=A0A6A7KCI1_9FIRM|nr:hypothetical protein [Alkalibaculum sporogenes]MPW27055.1 hypothetical protein [Alkalibaculum sporogenes]
MLESEIIQIKDLIVEEIEPEIIYYCETAPLHIFLVIWDIEMGNMEKHIYLRRILKYVNVPIDITTYSSKGFKKYIQQNFLSDLVNSSRILYEKDKIPILQN